jgi:hypothetical protein
MKVVNIYNQTFLGQDAAAYEWEFQIAPYITKFNQNNKWRITICNVSMYQQIANPAGYMLWSPNLGSGTSSQQISTQNNDVNTTMLIGVLGNYVNGKNMVLSNTSSPTQYIINDLSKSPFNVYYTNQSNLNKLTTPIQISFTLRMEEIEL